jgi:hypothetical protein
LDICSTYLKFSVHVQPNRDFRILGCNVKFILSFVNDDLKTPCHSHFRFQLQKAI